MPDFKISNHAREQMEFRNVSLEVVFVNIDKEPFNVITVYRTSKIEKYYEG